MQNNELYYEVPEVQPIKAPVRLYQAVKAMIFGLVALTLAEIPIFGIFTTPIFAIISLVMGADYKRKYPGAGLGFLKAGKVTAIVSLPLCVVSTVLCIVSEALLVSANYYYY